MVRRTIQVTYKVARRIVIGVVGTTVVLLGMAKRSTGEVSRSQTLMPSAKAFCLARAICSSGLSFGLLVAMVVTLPLKYCVLQVYTTTVGASCK